MQPKNKSDNQNKEIKRTFIEQARRAQIIEATIEVLAERGYLNTSFARIAERAGISAGLISYHFKDKEELTSETLKIILNERAKHVQERLAEAVTASDRLRIALESDLANMGSQPKRFQAAVEILFSFRSQEGPMVFIGDADTPLFVTIQEILESGQRDGEFGAFDAYNLAVIIEGARDTFLARMPLRPSFDLEGFTKTLVDFALLAAKKGTD